MYHTRGLELNLSPSHINTNTAKLQLSLGLLLPSKWNYLHYLFTRNSCYYKKPVYEESSESCNASFVLLTGLSVSILHSGGLRDDGLKGFGSVSSLIEVPSQYLPEGNQEIPVRTVRASSLGWNLEPPEYKAGALLYSNLLGNARTLQFWLACCQLDHSQRVQFLV